MLWIWEGFNPHGQERRKGGLSPRQSSLALANLALDGLEDKLIETFGSSTRFANRHKRNKVAFVRYGDDFIITGSSPELLEHEVKPLVEKHLAKRGLELSTTKTRITHIDKGFDFLGWTVRKYKGKCLVQPSRTNVKTFLDKCRTLFKKNAAAAQQHLIWQLNPVIRGWTNYHRSVAAGQTFTFVDHALWQMQWRWAKRRHPNKPAGWIMKRYFITEGRRKWIFAAKVQHDQTGEDYWVKQLLAANTKIRRHAKVRMGANPFNPDWDSYFMERQAKKLLAHYEHRRLEPTLLRRQKGLCARCQTPLTVEEGLHVHHIIERQHGGTDAIDNLQALHPICHRQIHSLGQLHSVGQSRQTGLYRS